LKTFHVLAVAVPVWLCAAAFAQTPPDAAPQRPALTPLNYRSVFTGYQAFNDQPVAPWRATNDTVEKIGGWRAYAKEAAQADTPVDASVSPDPHANHGAKP
jgi:hypothetical protein